MTTKINIDRLENVIKMVSVLKAELAYSMPPEDLIGPFRELNGFVASLRNKIITEHANEPPSEPKPTGS